MIKALETRERSVMTAWEKDYPVLDGNRVMNYREVRIFLEAFLERSPSKTKNGLEKIVAVGSKGEYLLTVFADNGEPGVLNVMLRGQYGAVEVVKVYSLEWFMKQDNLFFQTEKVKKMVEEVADVVDLLERGEYR